MESSFSYAHGPVLYNKVTESRKYLVATANKFIKTVIPVFFYQANFMALRGLLSLRVFYILCAQGIVANLKNL